MNIRPISDVLLVKLEPPRTTTYGGILRPDTSQHPVRVGHVVRAGPGRWWKNRHSGQWTFWSTEAKPGDRVVFLAALLQTQQGRQLQSSFALNDDEALIRETDVMLVLPEGEEIEVSI